jgi:hypothetical protein
MCRLENDAVLPFYKGSTFRGVFGIALKKVVCALKRQACESCLLKSRCLYTQVFETQLAIVPPAGLRGSAVPHPFVIEPPLTGDTNFETGSQMDCNLLLFGEVNRNLPYFIYAFDRMGRIGIGKKINGKRAAFSLKRVYNGKQVIYDSAEQNLKLDGAFEQLKLAEPVETADSDMKIKVSLKTPIRLKFANRIQAELPFHLLIRAALRRIATLFACYGAGEPALDYQGLVRESEKVRIVDNNLEWFDWRRFSNRQNQAMLMGGIIGSVTYEGKIGDYLLLLDICSKLHIGKQTSFGLGKIHLQIGV